MHMAGMPPVDYHHPNITDPHAMEMVLTGVTCALWQCASCVDLMATAIATNATAMRMMYDSVYDAAVFIDSDELPVPDGAAAAQQMDGAPFRDRHQLALTGLVTFARVLNELGRTGQMGTFMTQLIYRLGD